MKQEQSIQWDHAHHFDSDNKQRGKKVKFVFWLTTVVMLLEIFAGTWSGSMALLADGWHMGTHSAAFLITIFTYNYAEKHAKSQEFSFGTGKVSYLGGFASAVALAIVALMMALESIHRLIEPQAIFFNEAIAVGLIGLAVNIASVLVLHEGHHYHGEEDHAHHQDHNMKAAYFHVLADTLTSVLAIIALLTGKFFGWVWMDAIIGIVGAVVIGRWSYGLIQESSQVLLDKTLSKGSYENIAASFHERNDAIITDIHIWQIGAQDHAAIVAIKTKNPLSPADYKLLLKEQLPKLSHISIEVNRAK